MCTYFQEAWPDGSGGGSRLHIYEYTTKIYVEFFYYENISLA